MKGRVLEIVHGGRSANVELEDGDTRLFMRTDVRMDTTRRYQEEEDKELHSQLEGSGMETRKDQELEETRRRPRVASQTPNVDNGPPRRSSRLSRKKVTIVEEERSHNPRNLDYYMDAVQEGYAGLRKEDRQQEDAVVQETGQDQSLFSHSGPVDEEDLTLEDEA